jgi:hypothetical protein
MSIFRINPGGDDKTLKGIATGVSYSNAIFASRCYLLPLARAGVHVAAYIGVQSRENISSWLPNAAAFLFDGQQRFHLSLDPE